MNKLVIHDNDGHVDDLLSAMLLWLAPGVNLQAITVSEGDCYVRQSFETLLKIATYLDLEGVEIGYSEDPVINPFPDNWRKESFIVNELPIFNDNALRSPYQNERPRKSQVLISDCLEHSKAPVTLVLTGPLTNVASVFEAKPELKAKVESAVIMGGAFAVSGNVEVEGHDGTAEWNIYADPVAAKRFIDTGIPITFIPLDVTNKVPVTREFLLRLDEQAENYRASQLASKMYSLVKGFNYYFWDTLTAAAILQSHIFVFKEMKVDIVTAGKSMGRTVSTLFGGKKVKVAQSVEIEPFEELMLEILRRK